MASFPRYDKLNCTDMPRGMAVSEKETVFCYMHTECKSLRRVYNRARVGPEREYKKKKQCEN